MAHFSSDRCGKCLLFGWASSALLCFCPQPPPPPTCMMYCGRVPPQPPVAPRTPPALVFYCSTDAVRLVRDGRAAALRVAPRVRRGRGASAASRPTGRRLAAVARDRRSTPPCFERLGAGSAPGVTLVCSPLFFSSIPPATFPPPFSFGRHRRFCSAFHRFGQRCARAWGRSAQGALRRGRWNGWEGDWQPVRVPC